MKRSLLLTILLLAACAQSQLPAPVLPAASCETPARSAKAKEVAAIVDPIIREAIERGGVPGAAFVFVEDGRVVYERSYGFADRELGRAANGETLWPLASVSKVFIAAAALREVDRGALALDAPINDALRRVEAPSSYGVPVTLAHLLSHRSGFDEIPGRQFDPKAGSAPELAQFLSTRLKPYRAPGEVAAYSTYGIALAAVAVADSSGIKYPEYLKSHLFAPCGMNSTRFMMKPGDEVGVATPYEVDDGVARPIPYEWYVTAPTSSLVATTGDVARFMIMNLNGGLCGNTRILSEPLARAMRTQQTAIHPRVPGWGYGFQIDGENSRWLAEHGGDIGGFSALLTLIPGERAGFFIVSHGEGTDLRFRVKQALIDGLYPDPDRVVLPRPDPKDREKLQQYAGRYRSSLACHTCSERRGEDFELTVPGDGTIELWHQRWVPVARDLFMRDDGERMLAFGRDARGRISVVGAGSWRVAERIED